MSYTIPQCLPQPASPAPLRTTAPDRRLPVGVRCPRQYRALPSGRVCRSPSYSPHDRHTQERMEHGQFVGVVGTALVCLIALRDEEGDSFASGAIHHIGTCSPRRTVGLDGITTGICEYYRRRSDGYVPPEDPAVVDSTPAFRAGDPLPTSRRYPVDPERAVATGIEVSNRCASVGDSRSRRHDLKEASGVLSMGFSPTRGTPPHRSRRRRPCRHRPYRSLSPMRATSSRTPRPIGGPPRRPLWVT